MKKGLIITVFILLLIIIGLLGCICYMQYSFNGHIRYINDSINKINADTSIIKTIVFKLPVFDATPYDSTPYDSTPYDATPYYNY